MPYYEEISHIPLMIWHPSCAKQSGRRRKGLSQTTDLMPTFLEFHGCTTNSATGKSLMPMLQEDKSHRTAAVFGMFAGPVGVTDGKFAYYRYPDDLTAGNLHIYTLMPSHMIDHFNELELKSSELFPPFNFTKGISTLRMKIDPRNTQVGQDGDTLEDCQTVLYDIENDPNQTRPINETVAEKQLIELVALEFARHDAPLELYKHFDLRKPDA